MSWDMTPEEIEYKIAQMLWSFSRITSFDCAYRFYMQYIAEYKKMENGYSQFGKFCHEIIEKVLKGELDIFSAANYYRKHYYKHVKYPFPYNKYVDLGEKAYDAGEQYFENISFDFDRYEILGVERELTFKVGDYPFHGYADAIYRDKETNEIILRDHKTASFKYLKSGEISKTDKPHFDLFKKQLYLYSIPLIEEYGKVDKLTWNMIRDQKILEIPFDEKEYNETQEWAVKQIEEIKQEVLWLPNTSSSFYCHNICDHRNICPYI